jgi:hypothetical protein
MSYCNLMSRRSAFDFGNMRLEVQKLEVKNAGLAAEIQH